MSELAHRSEANGPSNEDFSFATEVGASSILVVGDFARTSYAGVNKLAVDALQETLALPQLSTLSTRILLVHLANGFNHKLLNMRKAYPDMGFQCCAVFAALSGANLHYLPVGDCRLAIQRNDALIPLNGSIWVDSAGHQLGRLITTDQKTQRGIEEPPENVLGVHPVAHRVDYGLM